MEFHKQISKRKCLKKEGFLLRSQNRGTQSKKRIKVWDSMEYRQMNGMKTKQEKTKKIERKLLRITEHLKRGKKGKQKANFVERMLGTRT